MCIRYVCSLLEVIKKEHRNIRYRYKKQHIMYVQQSRSGTIKVNKKIKMK